MQGWIGWQLGRSELKRRHVLRGLVQEQQGVGVFY